MTLVTFLGMLGAEQKKTEEVKATSQEARASYAFEPSLAADLKLPQDKALGKYHNMLPLLLEHLHSPDRIVLVGTGDSLRLQRQLLERHYPALARREVETVELDDTLDYRAIFGRLNDLLERDDELIVDISHSFRHLPILMVVELIIENVKDPSRIRHILFARELKKNLDYEIVDLREYLTLANISYALASFTRNYTVATAVRTRDEGYQQLLHLLERVSDHLLANSFESLLFYDTEGGAPLTLRIIETLRRVERHPTARPLARYLAEIRRHMEEIHAQSERDPDERYEFFARTMYDKGYMLNAVVLLDEALAAYCLEGLRRRPEFAETFQGFEAKIVARSDPRRYNRYELSSMAKNLVKFGKKFQGTFLLDDSAHHRALDIITRNYRGTQALRNLLFDCDAMRNNLAHGNSDRRLDDVRRELGELMARYDEVCRFDDPLGRFQTR